MKTAIIKEQAVKRIRNYYLWVYADEIQRRPERGYPGEVVSVAAPGGDELGMAFYHPQARIALRMLSRRRVLPDGEFFRRRLARAVEIRRPLASVTDAVRLVYAEGDFLPGLVVDSFANHLCVQFRCAGMDNLRPLMVELLTELLQPESIYERSDLTVREEEGLEKKTGRLAGETPERIVVSEHGVKFLVDLVHGQKTGFFTDQRDARHHVASFAGPGIRFLDAFSYTGGFGQYAARAGAEVTAVDKDADALFLLLENSRLNGLTGRVEAVQADLFEWLPKAVGEGRQFDVISLDPPALIKYKNQQSLGRGLFIDLIRPALRLLPPGGILHVSACAYHLGGPLMLEALRIGALEAGVRLRTLGETVQGIDHPYSPQMPENLYLKGFTCMVEAD